MRPVVQRNGTYHLVSDDGKERYNMFRNGEYDIMAIFTSREDFENAFVLIGRHLKSLNSDIFEKSAE
jgi:hypothetical protein